MLAATGGISPQFLIGYIIFFIALMYFMAIRPQQKEKKKQEALLASIVKSGLEAISLLFQVMDFSGEADNHHAEHQRNQIYDPQAA